MACHVGAQSSCAEEQHGVGCRIEAGEKEGQRAVNLAASLGNESSDKNEVICCLLYETQCGSP